MVVPGEQTTTISIAALGDVHIDPNVLAAQRKMEFFQQHVMSEDARLAMLTQADPLTTWVLTVIKAVA